MRDHTSRHALTENNLRCAVVPGGDDCTVVFVVKSSAAKIHYPHRAALHHTLVPLLKKTRHDHFKKVQTDMHQLKKNLTKKNSAHSLTFSTLYDMVKSELTKRIFSGFKSVWVSLLSCRTAYKLKGHSMRTNLFMKSSAG